MRRTVSSTVAPSRPAPSRRSVLRLGAAAPVALALTGVAAAPSTAAAPATGRREDAVAALERDYDTTIGLAAMNLHSRARLTHRAGERFPILSVFKALAAAAVLRDHDVHGETLDRRVWFPPADVLEYAPVAAEHVDTGMTVAQMCTAALQLSDNTAGNLLLREIGGPRGLSAFARSLGDHATRLDRWEPDLNTALPNDDRDTTTPAAIARTFARLLVGRALAPRDRRRLRAWMEDNQTSADRFRAGLPQGWRLADKTGAGDYGTNHDVGVAWTPAGTPIVIAALTRRDETDADRDNAVLADIARLVVARLG